MRRVAVGNHDANVAAVRLGGDQTRQSAAVGIAPSMQRNEARPVGAEQQMVEIMSDARLWIRNWAKASDIGERNDQL